MEDYKSNGDRFSGLPNSIIHQIFSFLGTEDMGRVSVVSKRCMQLSMSNPYLNFDVPDCMKSRAWRYLLSRYVHRMVSKATTIESFRLLWSTCHEERSNKIFDQERLVDIWIQKALSCDAKKINLDLCIYPYDRRVRTAFCLPLSATLKVLKLNLHHCDLTLPNFVVNDFVSLESLYLEQVQIVQGIGEWISQSCKRLKKLVLDDFQGIVDLNIISSSLEVLFIGKWECKSYRGENDLYHINVSAERLHSLTIQWELSSSSSDHHLNSGLKISAPNLQEFFWSGNTLYHYSTDYFASLQSADIILAPPCLSSYSDYNFDDLFKSIHQTKDLCIISLILEMLYIKESPQSAAFDNLSKLTIKLSSLKKNCLLVAAIASFLRRLPNLMTLDIIYFDDDDSVDLDGVQLGSLRLGTGASQNVLLEQLKEVKIELRRVENEVDLVKYLLEHATKLQKLILSYSSQDLLWQSEINDKLQEFKIASPSVAISFQPN